jgi:serine/threonine protein kinase
MADRKPVAPPTETLTAPFPERVGRYELLLPLGTGGMATVFLARARGAGGFERDVALKLLHAHLRDDEESKAHLLEEAKLAARIRHPNVVPVLEIDEDPFGLFMVMDYVEGETLSGLVQAARTAGTPMSTRIAARVLDDALAGLQAAHDLRGEAGVPLGLVHRDFSPQNILVATDGRARLADFGIAKAAGRSVRTKTGLVKGKVAYMAPEQARGHEVDRRCDVWAAGVVAWELVADRRLHDKTDDVATLLSVVTEEPPLLSSVLDHVSPGIEEAIASALTSDLEQRCQSAAELRQRLEVAWAEAGGMATADEVGELVHRVVGPRLVRRGARITEVRELREVRSRRGALPANEAVTELTMTAPSSSGRRLREPETTHDGPIVELASAEVLSATSTGASLPGTDLGLPETSAILAQADDRRSRRRNIASGVVAGTAVAALVAAAVAFTSTDHAAKETRAVAQAARNAGKPAQRPGSEAPPAPKPVVPDEPRVGEDSRAEDRVALPASGAAGAPTLGAARRPPAASLAKRPGVQVSDRVSHATEQKEAPKRAAPRSTAPKKLASDPYGGT